jgi:uncharacterized protein
MKIRDFKKEIKIYFKHQEVVNNRPVYKILIDKFVEAGITVCTIIKSNFGYGVDMKVVYPDNLLNEIWNRDSTIIITVIESESKMDDIIKIIDENLPQGLVSIRDVDVIRYTKTIVTPEDIKLAENT